MSNKGLRDPQLRIKARHDNFLQATRMNRYSWAVSVGVAGLFLFSMWAGALFYGPRLQSKREAWDYEKEQKNKNKNERYIHLLRMRLSVKQYRQEEIKNMLEAKATQEKKPTESCPIP